MTANELPRPVSNGQLWSGRVLTGLVTAFMLLDAVAKLFKPEPVVKATVELGYRENTIVPIGVVLLVCTVLYAIPRTTVLGAILLTGYLGGAVATHVRAGSPIFIETVFPILFGVLAWLGIYLRDPALRVLAPIRRG